MQGEMIKFLNCITQVRMFQKSTKDRLWQKKKMYNVDGNVIEIHKRQRDYG